ncbi:MAG: TRAP transporter small permease [Deltaproteobacteria bacterium]|nr:TRAP transporter small permease [Deltaproteobacteria bacterium]
MMKNLYGDICATETFVARITLWGMVVLIFSAGVARLLKYPINWAIDLSTCLFAWSCFLSGDIAWRENKLMCVDIFVRLFPEKFRRYFEMFNYVVIMGFSAYLIFFGIQLSYTSRERTFQGIPNFSYTWVTLSLPVGAIFLFMTGILKIRRDFEQNHTTK